MNLSCQCVLYVCFSNMAPSEKWVIYKIKYWMTSSSPVAARYQFSDGRGRRVGTSAAQTKAKLKAAKDKALYQQEGKLAAARYEEQRRDAAQAAKLLPAGSTFTGTQCFICCSKDVMGDDQSSKH